jgi:hypothetical protein
LREEQEKEVRRKELEGVKEEVGRLKEGVGVRREMARQYYEMLRKEQRKRESERGYLMEGVLIGYNKEQKDRQQIIKEIICGF